MKTKTGILQLLKSTLILAFFVSCTSENSEITASSKNSSNQANRALAPAPPQLIIDNSENEYNLSFRLTAFIDTNNMGSIDPTLSFRNPEVSVRRGETKYFTDYASIFDQSAGPDSWYKYDSNGFTGSILDGNDANASGGTFTNGIDDTNGYFSHWAHIKGTVSGVYLDVDENISYNFEASYKFLLSPLAGGLYDAQGGLIEIDMAQFGVPTPAPTLTFYTYLTQDAVTGDITVKFKYIP